MESKQLELMSDERALVKFVDVYDWNQKFMNNIIINSAAYKYITKYQAIGEKQLFDKKPDIFLTLTVKVYGSN